MSDSPSSSLPLSKKEAENQPAADSPPSTLSPVFHFLTPPSTKSSKKSSTEATVAVVVSVDVIVAKQSKQKDHPIATRFSRRSASIARRIASQGSAVTKSAAKLATKLVTKSATKPASSLPVVSKSSNANKKNVKGNVLPTSGVSTYRPSSYATVAKSPPLHS